MVLPPNHQDSQRVQLGLIQNGETLQKRDQSAESRTELVSDEEDHLVLSLGG